MFSTHPNLTVDAELLNARTSISFDVVHLCTAITYGCSIDSVRTYMEHYRKNNAAFQGMVHQAIPVLYYAIGRNSPEMVSLLLEYGFSPEGCINTTHFIPALAFAVIHGHLQLQDTTEIVKVLLAGGADPKSIPEDMWQRYLEQPSEERPTTTNYTAAFLQWCGKRTRTHLAHGLNLTQRYYLHRANSARNFEPREISEANLHDAEGILKLAYRIIGQLPVLHDLQQQILNQIASNVDNPAALVMVFAGPPGHGKTELATQLGGLLRVPTTTIVCSQMNTDTELLGSRNGYHGSTQGSTLNNHLSDNAGECSVVFLDEFDKSSQAVYNALLTIMSEGKQTKYLV
ncbi:hypothetical protein J4E80_008263 [Alternaria sp. BMP 0032]|nr:hypothetical protein J4E80_008263 [Alternaria sp. BMP 0032]